MVQSYNYKQMRNLRKRITINIPIHVLLIIISDIHKHFGNMFCLILINVSLFNYLASGSGQRTWVTTVSDQSLDRYYITHLVRSWLLNDYIYVRILKYWILGLITDLPFQHMSFEKALQDVRYLVIRSRKWFDYEFSE